MAGDWIKMRGALLDNPKVIAIGRALHGNKDFREWLTPGGSGPVNGQLVGNHALRCVTVALLMRVWSVSREHGHFVGDDLILEHSTITDLDEMAGAPGVGEAMQSVHWAIEENGVTLPNFKEFNVPMTPAEKQASYRERRKTLTQSVTASLPSDGNEKSENVTSREEKRRSKNIGASAFALPDFVPADAWQAFEEMRRKIRKPLTDRARQLVVAEVQRLRAAGQDPRAVIEQSVLNSWQSVFPLRQPGKPAVGSHDPTVGAR